MPPKIKFSREAVIDAGFALARESGMEALNARAIAARMGCSTQPLFREFQSMEQLKAAISAKALSFYEQYTRNAMDRAEKPYKAAGMAYLHFAQEETQLFKALFMQDRGADAATRSSGDPITEYAMGVLMANTGMPKEQAGIFYLYLWLFVHGMASMIATHSAVFTEEEMDQLVSGAYLALLGAFQSKARQAEGSKEPDGQSLMGSSASTADPVV